MKRINKHPPARDPEIAREMITEVCRLVREGSNLKAIGSDKNNGLPDTSTLYRWKAENRYGFNDLYAPAREARADSRADKIDEILEKVESGELQPNQGRTLIDGYKWQAAIEKPRTYSERQILQGDADNPIHVEASNQALAQALREALQAMPGNSDVLSLVARDVTPDDPEKD